MRVPHNPLRGSYTRRVCTGSSPSTKKSHITEHFEQHTLVCAAEEAEQLFSALPPSLRAAAWDPSDSARLQAIINSDPTNGQVRLVIFENGDRQKNFFLGIQNSGRVHGISRLLLN